MKFVALIFVVCAALSIIACTSGQPTFTPVPDPTPDIEATISAGIQATRTSEESANKTAESDSSNTQISTNTSTPTLVQEPTVAVMPTPASTLSATQSPSEIPTPTARPTAIPTLTQNQTQSTTNPIPSPTETPEVVQLTAILTAPGTPASVCRDAFDFLKVESGAISEILMYEAVSRNDFLIYCRASYDYLVGGYDGITVSIDHSGNLQMSYVEPWDYDCEFILPIILKVNLVDYEKDRSDREILKVYDVEELRRTPNKLVCGGFARTSKGESNLEFRYEEDIDGEGFWGYTFVENLARQSEADELLAERFFNCLTSDQAFRELLVGTELEGLLYYYDYDTFYQVVFNIWNSQSGVTDMELRELFEQSLELCSG